MPHSTGSEITRLGALRAAVVASVSIGVLVLLTAVAVRARGTTALADVYGYTEVEGEAFPKTLVARSARQVLHAAPERIASVTVAGDEMLTALVDPARLVAVSRFVDDPSISMCSDRVPKAAARIRGMDPESIIALTPDVVFVAHYTLDHAVRLLVGAGIPVARFRVVHSYADVEANVRLAASVAGEETRGRALVQSMNERLADVARRVAGRSPPRVLYYSPTNYTSGRGTLVDEKIRRAGGSNAAAEFGLVGFDNVTLDVLLALNPDVIVVPRWSTEEAARRDLVANPAWQDVPALRNDRVYAIAASALTSEAPDGVLGVEELGRLLFPEAFAS
jgi:iron complex transport system substrate-binding protein